MYELLHVVTQSVFVEGKRLDEQNVKNNSKIMVHVVSSEQEKTEMLKNEEEKRQQNEGLQRTQKGFQILSERGEPSIYVLQRLSFSQNL